VTRVEKTVSVPRAATLCGVNRATINNWIRDKKVYAFRSGRNYEVPEKELLLFLRSTGRPIPPGLRRDDLSGPTFKPLRFCWTYPKDAAHEGQCEGCVVFEKNWMCVLLPGKAANWIARSIVTTAHISRKFSFRDFNSSTSSIYPPQFAKVSSFGPLIAKCQKLRRFPRKRVLGWELKS
jgi:hypothetical protein